MYEQICQNATNDLKEVDRQLEEELTAVRKRLIELQNGKKLIKQIIDSASARLGTTSNVVIQELNLTELTRLSEAVKP
jgi:hypothetical protein